MEFSSPMILIIWTIRVLHRLVYVTKKRNSKIFYVNITKRTLIINTGSYFYFFFRTESSVIPDGQCLFYRDNLKRNYNLGKYFLEVQLDDLRCFDDTLADEIAKRPSEHLPLVSSIFLLYPRI